MALTDDVARVPLIPHSKYIVIELLHVALFTTPAAASIDTVASTVAQVVLTTN